LMVITLLSLGSDEVLLCYPYVFMLNFIFMFLCLSFGFIYVEKVK